MMIFFEIFFYQFDFEDDIKYLMDVEEFLQSVNKGGDANIVSSTS